MSTLLSNIRRASAPLQEQTQQIGLRARQLLVSAGSALSSADLGADDAKLLLTRGLDNTSRTDSKSGALVPSTQMSAESQETGESGNGRPPLTRSPPIKTRTSSSEEVNETMTETISSASSTHTLNDAEKTGCTASLPPPSPSAHGSEIGALMKSVPGSPSSNSSVPPAAAQSQPASQGQQEVEKPVSPDQPVSWRGAEGQEESGKFVVCTSRALPHLFTRMRDRNTPPQRFKFFAKRMMTILVEEVRSRSASWTVVLNFPSPITQGQHCAPPEMQADAPWKQQH